MARMNQTKNFYWCIVHSVKWIQINNSHKCQKKCKRDNLLLSLSFHTGNIPLLWAKILESIKDKIMTIDKTSIFHIQFHKEYIFKLLNPTTYQHPKIQWICPNTWIHILCHKKQNYLGKEYIIHLNWVKIPFNKLCNLSLKNRLNMCWDKGSISVIKNVKLKGITNNTQINISYICYQLNNLSIRSDNFGIEFELDLKEKNRNPMHKKDMLWSCNNYTR